MKKLIAIVLCVALLASVMVVCASAAFDPDNTNTSVTYLPVFEDFFNFDLIFDFFERIFNAFGFTSNLYEPIA